MTVLLTIIALLLCLLGMLAFAIGRLLVWLCDVDRATTDTEADAP